MRIIFLSPLFVFIAVAIRIESPGDVFFVQRRTGQNGVLFDMFDVVSESTQAWFACASGQGADVLFQGCELDLEQTYRGGLPLAWTMGLAALAVMFGPVPLVRILNRFRSNFATALLFVLVALPYSVVAFVLLLVAVLVMTFYLLRLIA